MLIASARHAAQAAASVRLTGYAEYATDSSSTRGISFDLRFAGPDLAGTVRRGATQSIEVIEVAGFVYARGSVALLR